MHVAVDVTMLQVFWRNVSKLLGRNACIYKSHDLSHGVNVLFVAKMKGKFFDIIRAVTHSPEIRFDVTLILILFLFKYRLKMDLGRLSRP